MDLCTETVWDTPNDGTQYAKLEEADRVYDFLARLNPKFYIVCGRILGQIHLPSLMEVCFEVCLEEDRTNVMGVLTTPIIDFTAFSARSSNHDSDKNNGKSIHDMSSERTIGTARHSGGLYILDDDTFCSSFSTVSLLSSYFNTSEQDWLNNTRSLFPHNHINLHNRLPSSIVTFGVLPRSPPHRKSDAAHLINRMHSRILHLQTPLDCLKESYLSTRLISEGESVSEESNSTFEFIEPTFSTAFDVDSHPIILPTNQVPWKTYYRRNLRKEVGSSTSQSPTPVQDFEPPRDQGMENPTEPCTNNTMSENDRSDVAVLENVEEKNRGDNTGIHYLVKSQGYSQGHSDHTLFTKGNLVTWSSKKQSVVARSSAEAEYRAMSLRICEEIWLQKVLSDLHQECETPLKLFCDNKAAISIANNLVQHDRTKHVEVDWHFIKERLDNGSICIPYTPSSQQVVDVLTKGLLRPHFDFCVSKLVLIDIYVPT
ncbi:putative mitochondrial protein [Cucumis melo var. makuwa]|uniref:Mitochondrial protein n=1 Tax=Cucumis melo var. makuwa TaxID=1194695 RepID=A0A5A7SWN3_CUCMM|nr:putative mitochondrial protein [Cucumis melo var. makuwa]